MAVKFARELGEGDNYTHSYTDNDQLAEESCWGHNILILVFPEVHFKKSKMHIEKVP